MKIAEVADWLTRYLDVPTPAAEVYQSAQTFRIRPAQLEAAADHAGVRVRADKNSGEPLWFRP